MMARAGQASEAVLYERGGEAYRASLAPALVAVVVCTIFLGLFLTRFQYNVSALIGVGDRMTAATNLLDHIASGVVVWKDSDGYDGQYYYVIARDPFLSNGIFPDAYRRQRILYPLAASLLAGGQTAALPYSLLSVNILSLGAIMAMLAILLRESTDLSAWWALLGGLGAGLVVSVQADLPDPLALALSLAALLLYQRRRHGWTAAALALALLAKESALLFVAALVLVEAYHHRWRVTGILAASVLPFLAYQGLLFIVTGQVGMLGSAGGANTALPLVGIAQGTARWRYDSWPELARSSGSILAVLLVLLAAVAVWPRLRGGERGGLFGEAAPPRGIGWHLRPYPTAMALQVVFALIGGRAIWEGYTSSSRLLIALVPLAILVYGEARREGHRALALRALLLGCILLSVLTLARPLLVTPSIPYFLK